MLLIWWNVDIVVSQLNSNAKSKQQKNKQLDYLKLVVKKRCSL